MLAGLDGGKGASWGWTGSPRGLAKRVIACLDVRANDNGDLVVTKGDQYDVREAEQVMPLLVLCSWCMRAPGPSTQT